MKAVLQLMGFQKKAQKEFRWDTVTVSKPEPENKRRYLVFWEQLNHAHVS